MKKFLGLVAGAAAFALASCGGDAEPMEEDMMTAEDVAAEADDPVPEVVDAEGMTPADDSAEAALPADEAEVGEAETEFGPTGNPIGPGQGDD